MSDDHQFNEPARTTKNELTNAEWAFIAEYLAKRDAMDIASLRESHDALLAAAKFTVKSLNQITEGKLSFEALEAAISKAEEPAP